MSSAQFARPLNSLRTLQLFPRPRANYQRIQSRSFTQTIQLIRTFESPLRPQILLLHATRSQKAILRPRSTRPLTTDERKRLHENLVIAGKCSLILCIVTFCFWVLKKGLQQWEWEQKYPEPPEFSWLAKWYYRTAKGTAASSQERVVNWMSIGNKWKTLIEKLEDPQGDGAGIKPRLGEGEELLVEGVGKTGCDITAKSEPWRRGYCEALMGAAKAGEHLDGWLCDKKRPDIAFPPDAILGPSNPRPKPLPHGWPNPPKEEDCEAAFDRPEVYYMKILTTEGFTSRQKLEAALSYADFLQSKALPSSASDMIDWSMDIASRNAPMGIVDSQTGIISDKVGVSENIILATSALAMHKVQNGNLAAALPIYLSILRAQRSLPPTDPALFANIKASRRSSETLYDQINRIFEKAPYPDAPATGDEQATRTLVTNCNEAATMAHIGEILYALSAEPEQQAYRSATKPQEAGISWTRDAVELAEATFESLSQDSRVSTPISSPNAGQVKINDSSEKENARERCAECLAMAIENWKRMVEPFTETERTKQQLGSVEPQKQSWTWLWNSTPIKEMDVDPGKWEAEMAAVKTKEKDLQRLLIREGLYFEDS